MRPAHIKPRHVDTMMSQIDIAPTVLGLLNFSYQTKFMGRDILRMDPARGRAFISTYQKLGFLHGRFARGAWPSEISEEFLHV